MNVYFDTSALVKLFLQEEDAEIARDLWDEADLVSVGRLAYPEARAAFAAAERSRRITRSELDDTKHRFDRLWRQLQVVELEEELARAAGDLAERYGLRGFDAVHLSTAIALQDASLVVATWDADLSEAAGSVGLPVAPGRA